MFAKNAIATAALCLSASVSSAAETGEICVGIKSDVARLECFDAAFKLSGTSVEKSANKAFKIFADLTNQLEDTSKRRVYYTIKPPCILFGQEIVQENYAPNYWAIMMDLNTIEIQQLSENINGGMNLVTKRGSSIYYSKSDFYGSPVLKIDKSPDKTLTMEYENVFKRIVVSYKLEFGPRNFRSFEERSVDWRFSLAWPEDSEKINKAFVDLVKTCQSGAGVTTALGD